MNAGTAALANIAGLAALVLVAAMVEWLKQPPRAAGRPSAPAEAGPAPAPV